MISAHWALITLALTVSTSAPAMQPLPVRAESAAPGQPAADIGDVPPPSEGVSRVIDWVTDAKDNGALPYAIVDKAAARIYLFNAAGELRGEAPVLVGIAIGDDATPGVGAKSLAALGPAEKTTPAGRFVAKYGVAAGRVRVLWVDYANSVALHPIPKGTVKERRRERMLSPTSEDNRITFGCINVPLAFYNAKVRPIFRRKGGVVYVLPDIKPIEAVFPRLHVYPYKPRDPA